MFTRGRDKDCFDFKITRGILGSCCKRSGTCDWKKMYSKAGTYRFGRGCSGMLKRTRLSKEVVKVYEEKNGIEAIKFIQLKTGWGLKSCKEYLDVILGRD